MPDAWEAGRVRRLVALDLPGGPDLVLALTRAWDEGDAVLVLDRRLAPPAKAALLERARPHVVVTTQGIRPGERGAPPVHGDDALVVATSGTTGAPKLVVHTRAGVEAHARAVHQHLAVDARHDRWLACLPLAHLGGLGVVLRSIVTDTPFDVLDGFDAETVAAAPTVLGTTLVSLVPTALDRVDAGSFRYVLLGGSADPAERAPNVVRTYGLTETGGGIVYDGVALPGVEVDIQPLLDPSGPAGRDGRIRLRSPTMARGLRLGDGTVVPVAADDGWLVTGDLGHLDPQGHLVVAGRADDLIVSGGENVWPTAVEAILARHPLVAEVMVLGRADPDWGQRVVARVVPTDPDRPPSLEDLRTSVREELAAHAAPRELELVEALPRTNLGKLSRG